MTPKREQSVWKQIFPLQVGDKVRIARKKYIQPEYRGRTGTITAVFPTWANVTIDKPIHGFLSYTGAYLGNLERIRGNRESPHEI